MDLGIYAYSFASSVLGSPASLAVHGSIADTGVDRESTAILSYSSGATAVLSTSLLSRTPTRASISGTDALLEFASPFFIPTTMSLSSSASGSSSTHWTDTSGITGQEGLSYQAAALVRYVDEGRIESAIHPLSEVVSVIAAIDATRELMNIRRS
jgi:predicted dehydrogenase